MTKVSRKNTGSSSKSKSPFARIIGGLVVVGAFFSVGMILRYDPYTDQLTSDLLQQSNHMLMQYTTVLSLPSSSSSTKTRPILDTLLKVPGISAELVWDQLVEEGSYQMRKKQVGVVMEVGMHKAKQCLQAATAGLQSHCIEPSPTSFQRVKMGIQHASSTIQSRTHLYQYAAGSESGNTVPFIASGGTGDHVGNIDMWNMQPGTPTDEKLVSKQGQLIDVPTIRVDDIIASKLQDGETNVFLIKVDTQGFEPSVLAGLSDSLRSHKIQFLLMEYWPHGMDLIMNQPPGTCEAAALLQQLMDYGYTIYALPANSHPRAPPEAQLYIRTKKMSLQNSTSFCQWLYNIEQLYPSSEYKMGYWADILAVAPNIQLPKKPTTDIAKVILTERQ
jgi:FkbM family methyltransferase